ncbi:hypothetical protein F5883DRAFT_684420 [Diaporthe sp. PMI_573]|nr:hypothetical protein F5883DRAFT_684420 [Diaporthaceae sp. PMI_573]
MAHASVQPGIRTAQSTFNDEVNCGRYNFRRRDSKGFETTDANNPQVDKDKITLSLLVESIVAFWSLILQSPSWPLQPLSEGDQPENTGRNDNFLARLVLQEELDRLRQWRVSFSDNDLDRLCMASQATWQAVLECFVNIAKTLTREYDNSSSGSGDPAAKEVLDLGRGVLSTLVSHFEDQITESQVEDTVMTEGSFDDESVVAEMGPRGETFLKVISEQINRLQRLSIEMCLLLTKV